MDVLGNKEARIWVSMIKAKVPEVVCNIIDQAMQVHGATGISQWSPLSGMYAQQRTLRYADGPDEVHHHVIARNEVQTYKDSNSRQVSAKSENKAARGSAGVRG
jgi:acyl-CoA dehydrogenase